MDYGRIAAGVAIYLVVGFMMWLDTKTKNDISMKTKDQLQWREPQFFKIVLLWLPFFIINLLPWKLKGKEWLYK